eukprot:scaffold54795_cov57-Phaeocystis_antarctica.AAC.1
MVFSRGGGQPFVSACQLQAPRAPPLSLSRFTRSGVRDTGLSESFVSHSHTHTRSAQVTRKIDYGTIWTHARQHALGPLGPG